MTHPSSGRGRGETPLSPPGTAATTTTTSSASEPLAHMMTAPLCRTVLSAPRMLGQVRFNSGPSGPAGPAAGATASSGSFKNREQGEESVYIKQHEAEQLKKCA